MFGWYKEVSHDWWCFNIRTLFLPGRDQNENDGFPWQQCFKWILIDTKFINDNLLPDPRSIIIVAWKGDTANTDKLSHSPIEQWIQWVLKDLHLVLRLHFEFIWIAVVAEFNVGFSNFLVHSPSEGWLMFTMVLLEPCSCVSGKCLDSGCVASWWWWGWRFDIRQLLHGHTSHVCHDQYWTGPHQLLQKIFIIFQFSWLCSWPVIMTWGCLVCNSGQSRCIKLLYLLRLASLGQIALFRDVSRAMIARIRVN